MQKAYITHSCKDREGVGRTNRETGSEEGELEGEVDGKIISEEGIAEVVRQVANRSRIGQESS